MVNELISHSLPEGQQKRRISKSICCSLTGPLAFLCLILSSCYPWVIRPIEGPQFSLQLHAGTSKIIVLNDIDNAHYLRDVRLEIFGAGGWHGDPGRGQPFFVAQAQPDGSDTVNVQVEATKLTPPGVYQGQIKLQLGPDKPGLVSLVEIKVVPGDVGGTKIIPTRPAFPSSDRIVSDGIGQVVGDELTLTFALNTDEEKMPPGSDICGSSTSCFVCPPLKLSSGKRLDAPTRSKLSPAEVRKISEGGIVCAIAEITGGVFLGSVPEAKAYQIRYPDIDNLEELAAKRNEILKLSDTFPELIAVSRSFIVGPAPAISADDYTHNATAFNAIGINTNGGAWDKATVGETPPIPGNPVTSSDPPRIPVAVIDVDFRHLDPCVGSCIDEFEGTDSHGINFDNLGYVSETLAAYALDDRFHGNKVAGLIGARGHSGDSTIAGMIWDVDLRLYDFARGQESSAIHMLRAMVKAIDNMKLCSGCADDEEIDHPAGQPLRHPRVINISHALHPTYLCNYENKFAESNAILGQGILYGLSQNKDILWVFAAGNAGRDAGCEAPAGLTGTFPVNAITVAAASVTGTSPTDATATLWDSGLYSSNTGPFVSVAAPGANLRVIRNPNASGSDQYPREGGTSLAASTVSGLAALIFSQKPNYTARKVKQCIVQNADIAISGSSNPFKVINAGNAMPPYTDTNGTVIDDCQPGTIDTSKVSKLDVVLSIDTTGSMRQEINVVKTKAQEIVNEIISAIGPGTSCPGGSPADPDPADDEIIARECCEAAKVCFSVLSYEDYPNPTPSGSLTYDSSVCGTSTYNRAYGSAGDNDKPFRIHLKLTDDGSKVVPAIAKMTSRYGADGPESYARVFWEVAEAVGNAAPSTPEPTLGFLHSEDRNSLKIIINFGDNVPHDTSLNGDDLPCRDFEVGCTRPCVSDDDQNCRCADNDKNCNRLAGLRIPNPPEINPFDTGIDPGPDEDIDCLVGDVTQVDGDIDLQRDALMDLINQKVRLVHIDSSEREDFIPYWSVWTQATGGAFARIRTDGTSMEEPGSDDYLPMFIVELLASIPVE